MPVIELAKVVAELPLGEMVTVVCDDPGAKVDIPVWCRMKKQELVETTADNEVFRFTVRRAI